ncbi:MAG TPA: lysylphosphatidylglycerol synthase domain-containing protein [Polyangiaceae bacterium]|nr:lysylphosphatidylglycerol synthase domain-containing protein [Polyangiaceae bacterium]
MSKVSRVLKPLASVVLVACAGYFFFRAFQRNWASIREHDFQLKPAYLLAAALGALATSLLGTLAWCTSLNGLSTQTIGFRQSVAAVNASNLTKYIPGKIWSYALQMYWLDGLGFSKGLVVYVNLMNLAISLGTSLIFGLVCLAMSSVPLPASLLLGALAALLLLDVGAVLFNRPLVKWATALINRVLKRDLAYIHVRPALLLRLHAIHLLAAVTSGLGAYAFCFAIGYRISADRGLTVIGSALVADVAGFLAIVVPGGIGVREGLMYSMLGGQATGSLAIIMPVASRLLNMAVDVLLGAVAFRLLKTLTAKKPTPA